MKLLNKYKNIIGAPKVAEIIKKARPLRGKYILHVNATYYGGGVAQILDRLVVLMNDIGINACWSILKGNEPFFEITKTFHNGTQGEKIKLTNKIKKTYEDLCERNSVFMNFNNLDAVIAHDPQVLPLINYEKQKKVSWIWRCHTDITNPNKELWKYLKTFIRKYNHMIVSDKKYLKKDLKIKQSIIMPSIDPLSDKNRDISEKEAREELKKLGIKNLKKPIVSQISRYDHFKDPLGVLAAFSLMKKKVDCQLVLLGNFATDDPEGDYMYKEVKKKARGMRDVTVLANIGTPLSVNALQKMSAVVLQKSIKEGFALTVAEALWKRTPVVAGNVGGIPNQIIDGKNGYLIKSIKECADRTVEILKDHNLRKKMGDFGREHVKENFLITRHLLEYIDLLVKTIK